MRTVTVLLQAALLFAIASSAGAASTRGAWGSVTIDASEAQATLAILNKLQRHEAANNDDWGRLFSTRGYQRLKEREAKFHRAFTDDDFKQFLTGPQLVAKFPALQATLARWTSADITQLAQRALVYLPAGSTMHATVYPLIKPKKNSFVYELDTDPAIMLYLDPTVSKEQFSNTVSHELYHVGDAQNCPPPSVKAEVKTLSPAQQNVFEWLGAFGEGSAVLAAAGGPDVHPHAEDPPADRAVWDRAMSNYDADFQTLQQFFSDIADGKLTGQAIPEKGYTFFGEVQGPWYTVGYKMDVVIERAFGREKLIEALCDKREYLGTYNAAAAKSNAAGNTPLPLWSPELATLLEKKP